MEKYGYLKYVINNAWVLRSEYRRLLYPFFDVQEIRNWRNKLYELDMEEWVLDRIWEFLNCDIELDKLKDIYERLTFKKL